MAWLKVVQPQGVDSTFSSSDIVYVYEISFFPLENVTTISNRPPPAEFDMVVVEIN